MHPNVTTICRVVSAQLAMLCSIASVHAESTGDSAAATEAWVQSLGGQCQKNATGAITGVELRHAWLSESDLKRLARLPELEAIDLAYTKVTDEGLEQLKPLGNVRSLNLYYAEYVTDAGIAHLKNWGTLVHLNVRGTKVTSTLFEYVVNMPALQSLDVGFSRVNDDNFERLGELPSLKKFAFGGNKMSGTALPLLKLLPQLHELSVGGQQRTDSGLWSVNVTDFNVGNIADLADLTVLELSGVAISDHGVTQLARLKQLESLDLSRTKVTTKGIAALAALPALRHLKLAQCANVDDSALAACERIKNLELLELQETKISFEGLMKFSAPARLKQCFIGGVELTTQQAEEVRMKLAPGNVSWWPPQRDERS